MATATTAPAIAATTELIITMAMAGMEVTAETGAVGTVGAADTVMVDTAMIKTNLTAFGCFRIMMC